MPQDFVLPATPPWRAGWALLHLAADNDFLRVELISGEVDVAPVGEPIPVVVADLGIFGENLTEDQVSAEQVLNDQCGHSALTPGCIVGMPVLHIVRVARIHSPAGPQYRLQQFQANRQRF